MKTLFYSVTCKIIFLTVIIFCASFALPPSQEKTDLRSIVDSLEKSEHSAAPSGKKIIFMIRFTDFGCQPCLENFFVLCDTVSGIMKNSEKLHVYLLFLREESSPGYQLAAMKGWAKSSGLPFPVALVARDVFESYGIGHSSVLITGEEGLIHFRGEIPLSRNDISNIVKTLQK